MKLFKKAKKGFTLVELVVVIAVIAILSAVSVGAYFGITESAKQSKAEQEGKAFHTNLVLLANTPNNGFCTLGADGLTITASAVTGENPKSAEQVVVDKVAEMAGVTYGENYSISFKDHETDSKYDCVKFTLDGKTVYIDVVTGTACTETHN